MIEVGMVGSVGVIRLNRPKALNALNLEMVRALTEVLKHWEDDPSVVGIVLRGSARPGEDAANFCAGGDIRFMHSAALSGDLRLDDFFTEEYALDHMLHSYPKPIVAWMEGIVMGGGMGMAQGASLRVVTERAHLAMPETRIGLFPDVAAGYFLSRCPGRVGEYLGVCGKGIAAAEALAWGLADAYSPAHELDPWLESLAQKPPSTDAGFLRRARAMLSLADQSGMKPSVLLAERERIDRYFAHNTVAEILSSLATDDSEWARQTIHHMAGNSPLMMCVTLEQIRRARAMSLSQVFRMERDMVRHCFGLRKGRQSETVEGIRALVVDKDHQPMWNPGSTLEVSAEMVQVFFESPWPQWRHPLRDLS
ncbi:enoyl-CoA hydratase/isomerase family protein [Aquabacterium sp.]|uniref:enoyl-CoA hydratase/isomerase family protein n=1 Tax=Aquabacterium sp. TaxID=1872578 RepID=UPI0019AD806C|nr:enoyl-CoA hydratase/isomerase family protein [Aquabacterium sp.]MBC7701614.1 enoyl-CoA hydratase/isomerase family protein [Aquabacterium sp.]